MQRRTFIHLSAYTAIAIALPVLDGCTSTDSILEQPFLFGHFADTKTIKETGLAYRKLFPNENSTTALKQLLLGSNPAEDKKLIEKSLDDRIIQDFKTGKTVKPDGWILSVTEARQCALYSILNA